MPSASTLVNTMGMLCLFSSSSIMWRVLLRMPLRGSIEVARWPGARIRSVAPSFAIVAMAVSLLRAPSPSENNILKGP
eukprot:4816268-Pyramimonas_sp.AAC.1